MKTGIELIAKERNEQIEKHNRTIKEDVICNNEKELKDGAIALLTHHFAYFSGKWGRDICRKMFDKEYKERLIIAGAFIAAEIDRLQSIKTKKVKKLRK